MLTGYALYKQRIKHPSSLKQNPYVFAFIKIIYYECQNKRIELKK